MFNTRIPLFNTRIPLIVVDAVMIVARTVDAAIGTTSIQNAREALVEGRRNQVIRSLLEENELNASEDVRAATGRTTSIA